MIRIDEIYSHTFWPWIRKHAPKARMFYCDPFGHTGAAHLFNFGHDDIFERGYVFMHDQEPVQLQAHQYLFETVLDRIVDMDIHWQERVPSVVVLSERGENVRRLQSIYKWHPAYYFFHGWACLDWYRGYNHTFLFDQARDRSVPSKTFCSPNRIIGGERRHRVLFVYHLQSRGLIENNYVSCPFTCPDQGTSILDIASCYSNIYPNIEATLRTIKLPLLFRDESIQLMTSCWLSNFAEMMDSLIYVPTETVFFGDRQHLTEKTFKPIALGMPFILVAAARSLEYLRSYGFLTFGDIWDESYDHETDDLCRLQKIADLLSSIDNMTPREKHSIWQSCIPIIEHNWNHFYHGGLEAVLWPELLNCLGVIRDRLAF